MEPQCSKNGAKRIDHDVDRAGGSTGHERLMYLVARGVERRQPNAPKQPALFGLGRKFRVQGAHEQDGKYEIFTPMAELTNQQDDDLDTCREDVGK